MNLAGDCDADAAEDEHQHPSYELDMAVMPSGWVRARVEQLGQVQLGRQRSPKDHQGTHMRPYLRVANVYEDRIDTSDVKEMNFSPSEYETFALARGDVLLNEGQSRELVGRPAIYRDEVPGACFQNTLVRFRPGEYISSEFALLLFRHALHSGRFQRVCKWTTNIAHLGATRLSQLEMPLPPLKEQHRIVAKIEALTARSRRAKAALDAIPPLIEKFKQSVLAAAFRGDLTAEWRKQHSDIEPASEQLERIRVERRRRWEEAELAKMTAAGKAPKDDRWKEKYREPEAADTHALSTLPEGWQWSTVDAVGDVILGRQRAPQYLTGRHTRSYLRVANIKDDRIEFGDLEEMDFDAADFQKYVLRPGDILVSEGQSLELVGQSAIFRGEVPDLCFQKTLHRVRPFRDGPSSEFIQLMFRACVRGRVFRRYASITTNIAHLTLEKFRTVPFPVPPAAEQDAIVRVAARLLRAATGIADVTSHQAAAARRLDQSMLAKAFRGELVPQDPNDEPASVTLERISSDCIGPSERKTLRSRR